MSDRSFPFIVKLLTLPPLNLPLYQAQELAPDLRNFWSTIADGDAMIDYPHFPHEVRHYIKKYSATNHVGDHHPIDNNSKLLLSDW